MHSTRNTIVFVLILTTVVALVLSLLSTQLRPAHERNESLFNKRAILSAVDVDWEVKVKNLSDAEVEDIFTNKVKQIVLDMDGESVETEQIVERGYKGGLAEHIDMKKEKKKPEADRILPLYVYTDQGQKYYIVSVRGNGLWDEIWGNIALKDDFNTIVDASFDHQGETPGLGAEIKDNPKFSANFVGKKILEENGDYVGITVRKGGAKDPYHDVDGISGATITANGVTEMLKRGMAYYEPYFEQLETQSN